MKTKGAALQQISVDDLSERISVISYQVSRNSRGDIVKNTEITRCTIWAKVLPLSGRIKDTTPERENSITYRITIRYGIEIFPDEEIKWRGRKLKITSPPINLENKKIWTQFDCREVIQDGQSAFEAQA